MIKVSFIIPFYNGVKTIKRTLDSIYQLSFCMDDFEVIIVDDCSPIMADDILVEYLRKFSNMHIIRHTKNIRQGGAKNTGISLAKGKYIAFIDQDDMINATNMSQAIDKAIEQDVDIVSCYYTILHENGDKVEVRIQYPNVEVTSGVVFCERYYDTHDSIGPWSYIYKTEYLHKLGRPMQQQVLLEDPDWTIWHLIHAETVSFFSKSIYVWVMNPNSITHSINKYSHRVDWIKAGFRKIEDAYKYRDISIKFSDKIIIDGQRNIEGGFRRLWKVDNYHAFYSYLGDSIINLRNMNWRGIMKIYVYYPLLSKTLLYLFGTPLKLIYYAKKHIQ